MLYCLFNMSNESTTNNEWQAREIGALWKKDGQNQKYLSGKIKLPQSLGGAEMGVVVFTNRHKAEGSNQPDFRLYLDSKSAPAEEAQTEQAKETVEEGIL